ncbi:MAG: hypothetical protein ACON4T_04625 [Synechococcus sp.]
MRHLALLLPMLSLLATASAGFTQSSSALLEGVKSNPKEAKAMCNAFQQLNQEDQSALAEVSIRALAKERGLSINDAEILATYVIGLHCPDVH